MRIATALCAALMLAACGNHDSTAPLPRAYPRIELYPDTTVGIQLQGLRFDVNGCAATDSPRPGWLDISYPRYRATIHITARHLAAPDSLAAAIEARAERMALNLGESHAELVEFDNEAGFRCRILTSTDGGPVPVQFLAVRPDGALLSGTAVLHGANLPADSISPVVRALARDATSLLQSLR